MATAVMQVDSEMLRRQTGREDRVDSSELNDFISEIQDIESEKDRDVNDEQSDDELNKTPDEGEIELTWIKDAGLENIAHRYEEGKEITEDIVKKETATLTRKQSEAVKKRVNTLNNTIKKKQKQQHRSDVRGVFALDAQQNDPVPQRANSQSPVENRHKNGVHASPVDGSTGQSPRRSSPNRKDSKKVTIVRLPSRGEYSMQGSGSNGSQGVETISILQKEIPASPDYRGTLPTAYRPHTLVDDGLTVSFKAADQSMDTTDLNNSTTNNSPTKSKKDGLPNFIIEQDTLGVTRVKDLGKKDMMKVRSLALIELTALFDIHELAYTRRKSKKRYKESGVFGVPLQTLYEQDCKRRPNLKVPVFVTELIKHLETCGLDEEGILRVPGSATRIKQLRQEIDDKFQSGRFCWDDVLVNDAASMLKQYIRDLPVPLLTFEYLEAFAEVESIPDPSLKQQLQALNLLVLMLPEVHRNTLQLLLTFLKKVVDISDNKMTLNNVAMIISPNLFLLPSQRKGTKSLPGVLDITYAARKSNIVRMLIKYQDILWTVPSFILSQVRKQYEIELVRKGKERSPYWVNFMKLLGRKEKTEPLKKPAIQNQVDYNDNIIRVLAPHMMKDSTAVQLDTMTTAYDIVGKFDYTDGNQSNHSDQGSDHSSAVKVDWSKNSTAKETFFSTTHLYEEGGNIGERKLDHNTKMLALYKVNPNARWLVHTSKPD